MSKVRGDKLSPPTPRRGWFVLAGVCGSERRADANYLSSLFRALGQRPRAAAYEGGDVKELSGGAHRPAGATPVAKPGRLALISINNCGWDVKRGKKKRKAGNKGGSYNHETDESHEKGGQARSGGF